MPHPTHIRVKIVVGSEIIYSYTLLLVYTRMFYCSLHYSVDLLCICAFHLMMTA
jgi:hypothetical protein